jgi:hypothetical protein
MSFEFDPNDNIDRAEVDNNPQDVESYLGGEGLYGRVPGGPQVGAANRSQGQPFGDQGLPIRLGQAQARGGLGQARGGPVPRSAGQRTSPDRTRHVGTCSIPLVTSCFSSIRLCDPHKQILWVSKAPSC